MPVTTWAKGLRRPPRYALDSCKMLGLLSHGLKRVSVMVTAPSAPIIVGPVRAFAPVPRARARNTLQIIRSLDLFFRLPYPPADELNLTLDILRHPPLRRLPEFIDFVSARFFGRRRARGGTLSPFQFRVGRLRRGVGVTLSSTAEVEIGGVNFFTFLPVIMLSTSLVAMAVGLPRRFRGGFVSLGLLAAAVRRYAIVTFGMAAPSVRVAGVLPEFSPLWAKVNRPAEETFEHPITRELLLDTHLSREQAQLTVAPKVLTKFIKEHREPADLTSPLSDKESAACRLASVFFFDLVAASSREKLVRYSLTWGSIFFIQSQPHGFIKAKRARSIKRRQSKKLVRRTQFRFWDL